MAIELRTIRESDRPRIQEISAQIWRGEDYVPSVLEEWFADRAGEAVGAVVDGTLIAFARRTWLCPGQAWFEGIRTDPAFRGLGAGRALTQHLIESARHAGAERIHLSTHRDNEASIHIIESFGFARVASFALAETDVPEIGVAVSEPTGLVDIDETDTAAFVGRSDFLDVAARRFPRGWRFFPFDVDPAEAVARLATKVGILREGQLVALACVRQPVGGRESVTLNFADGDADDLRLLIGEIHRRYAGRHIEAMVPKTSDGEARLLRILREFSYTHWNAGLADVFLYEMTL